jgi:hypothetical protein
MPTKHLDRTIAAKVQAALQEHRESTQDRQTVTAQEAASMLRADVHDAVQRGLSITDITEILSKHMPDVSPKTWAQHFQVRAMRKTPRRGTSTAALGKGT